MQNRVRLKKNQLAYFRKLARNSPNELMAYLIGEVVNPNLSVVDNFEYPPSYAVSTPHSVSWFLEDYSRMRQLAANREKYVIGFIHSHPEWDAVMSPQDYEHTLHNGFRLCGIVSTQGRKTRPRFWVTDTALPCEIEYAKNKPKITSEG